MCTIKEEAIDELLLARDLIHDAALNVSHDLFGGASVGIAKARFAIEEALSKIEQAASVEETVMPRFRASGAREVEHTLMEIRR